PTFLSSAHQTQLPVRVHSQFRLSMERAVGHGGDLLPATDLALLRSQAARAGRGRAPKRGRRRRHDRGLILRILILNWRCPRNPRAGGAESLAYEIARRLVVKGHEVEWFSASFPGAPPVEEMEGIRIVRVGRQWTVHWHAFKRYRMHMRRHFD